MYFLRHCFISRPSDSNVSKDAGKEPSVRIYRPSFRKNKPKTLVFSQWKRAFWAYCFHENCVYKFGHRTVIANFALTVSRSYHPARPPPHSQDLIHTRLDLINTRLDLIHTRLDLIHIGWYSLGRYFHYFTCCFSSKRVVSISLYFWFKAFHPPNPSLKLSILC